MLHSFLAQTSTLLAVLAVVWALARGRWPERAAALAIAVDWSGGILLQDRHAYHHLQVASFVLDAGQAATLLALVVRCRRTWVLWAAALAVLLVLTHVAMLLTGFGQWTYLSASYVWSLGLLATLAIGVAAEGRRPVAPLSWAAEPLTAAGLSTPSATARNRS